MQEHTRPCAPGTGIQASAKMLQQPSKTPFRASSNSPDAEVQIAVVVHDAPEASCQKHVLLVQLLHPGPLHKLQRLRAAVRQVRRGVDEGLALVRAVAHGHDVLPPVAVVFRQVDPRDLALEGPELPLKGGVDRRRLVLGAGREQLDVLQQGAERRHELLAAQLDPAPLGVGHQDQRAQPLGEAQRLGREPRELPELRLLRLRELGLPVQAQALVLDPGRREDRVVPVEDQDRLLHGEAVPLVRIAVCLGFLHSALVVVLCGLDALTTRHRLITPDVRGRHGGHCAPRVQGLWHRWAGELSQT
mmetsp:Transcript_83155/g.258162  ORF Transcript_83155/g.258162 Transcript_83155/m.258162 type:complete len:303 (+) Transcript_83155:79-987(+)